MDSSAPLIVFVYTGDKRYAGTNNTVHIKLHSDEGKSSKDITLNHFFSNDFERGNVDSFELSAGDLEDFDRSVIIDNIELWKDRTLGLISDDWYLVKVVVENKSTNESYVFPILRWIKCGQHYRVKLWDTSLPQDDPYKDQRIKELEEKKKAYVYHQRLPNGPVQAKTVPYDEEFPFQRQWNLATTVMKLKAKSTLHCLFPDPWNTIEETKFNHENDDFRKPKHANTWDSDLNFGRQRLAGVDPCLIKLVTSIPEKFPVTDELLGSLLEGLTIAKAIKSKKLYITDLYILEGTPSRKGFTICTPFALFFVNSKKQLVPVAIQLFQEPAENNPIFTPNDPPMLWKSVKMWYNNAEAQHHQSVAHLGLTHLLCEGFVLATHRNLSPTHPIFKLLTPHLLYIIAINWNGIDLLMSEGSWTDKSMNMGSKGLKHAIVHGFDTWRLGVEGLVPEDLKARGVDDPNLLPGYHYAEDALLIFEAIKKYVDAYVNLYYTNPQLLQEDTEIQAWAHELVKERNEAEGGCGLKEVPGNGKLTSCDELVKILTSCIYTSSVMHAAINFPQYDEYAFPPNYAAMLKGNPPSSKEEISENDIMASLPNQEETFGIMLVATVLSELKALPIGNFEIQYVFDPKALDVIKTFRDDLEKVSKTMGDRNSVREVPYDYLDPATIPNSISS